MPYISDEPKVGNLAYALKERLQEADCLVVIAKDVDSPFIQNEIALAYGMGKPIAAIYHESVEVRGILPLLCTWVTFKNLQDCSPQVARLKDELAAKLEAGYVIPGGPESLLTSATSLGILGVYPNRAAAFNDFARFWERENEISIVASTLEGFRKGIGIDPRELLMDKLKNVEETRMRILLTHPDFISFRERQERVEIRKELDHCRKELREIHERSDAGDRLTWRFFQGAPTCFMTGLWRKSGS